MHHHSTSDPKVRSRQNLIGLAVHATVFLTTSVMMFVLNMTTSPEVPWFIWSLGGWGIGLAMHTVGVLKFETLSEPEQQAELEREAARYARYGRAHGCGRGRRHTALLGGVGEGGVLDEVRRPRSRQRA